MSSAHKHKIRFCPLCGTPTEIKTVYGQELPVCPACRWVHFEDPKVAAAVLVRKNGSVLLTRRVFEPHKGSYTLPAGFMNAHETPEEAAIRECREETGLDVEITGLLDVLGGREHPRGADMVIVYNAQVIGGQLKAGDDADYAAFFPLNDLPPLAFKATQKILSKSA